jgi:O-antigen/teichoic acid export membrane protein
VFRLVSRSTRIIVNTVSSYARLAVAAASGFITLPLVLRTLGTTDFGIFSVIAGSLSVLLFINGALTGGAQRHISYALGEGSTEEAGQWFSASLAIHAILALAMLVAALLSSHWVVYRLLSLPPARLDAAMWIYRAVVIVLFCSILSTPYQALLMAKESITALSLMSMVSSLFLVTAVCLLKFLPGDPLLWYSGMYMISDGFLLGGPILFCLFRYSECRQFSSNAAFRKKIRDLLGFSSWNLLGTLAVQLRYQGPAILLNRFVGTTANAANGIAMQVNGFTSSVSTGLLSAASPSIVKAEGSGNRAEMLFFSNLSNKYAFVLLWLLVGPVLFELKYCLGLWLHQMPADTVVFSAALLVALLVDMLTAGFTTAVQAEGNIALYQGVLSLLLCISVPAGYLFLRFHMPASSVLWALVGSSALAGAGRLWFLCNRIGLKASQWLMGVLRPCLVTCLTCGLAMGMVVISVKPGWLRLACLYALNFAVTVILAWSFASSDPERRLRENYVSQLQEQAFIGSRRMFAFATRR